MTVRNFDDGFWSDPFIQKISRNARYLYIYLWTNKHCNQAGLYEITPSTISFETGFAENELPQLFEDLSAKVRWFAEENLVWVKNFVRRQTSSPMFLIAVAKCLAKINCNGAVQEMLKFNLAKYTLSIPYEYHINTLKAKAKAIGCTGGIGGVGERGRGKIDTDPEDFLSPVLNDDAKKVKERMAQRAKDILESNKSRSH